MANWVKRKRYGNTTITQNLGKGTTISHTTGSKGNRNTTTQRPDGSIKYTRTMTTGGWTKRETSTFGGKIRVKKYKAKRYRSRKMTKGEAQALAALMTSPFFWVFSFFILMLIGLSK